MCVYVATLKHIEMVNIAYVCAYTGTAYVCAYTHRQAYVCVGTHATW